MSHVRSTFQLEAICGMPDGGRRRFRYPRPGARTSPATACTGPDPVGGPGREGGWPGNLDARREWRHPQVSSAPRLPAGGLWEHRVTLWDIGSQGWRREQAVRRIVTLLRERSERLGDGRGHRFRVPAARGTGRGRAHGGLHRGDPRRPRGKGRKARCVCTDVAGRTSETGGGASLTSSITAAFGSSATWVAHTVATGLAAGSSSDVVLSAASA